MAIAGETRSDARVASEGPRAPGTSRPGGLSYPEGIKTGRSLLPRGHQDRAVSPTGNSAGAVTATLDDL